ncbi:uncharacterized protein LOC127839535 [Dreissena polymorpha]|nr:uncharacterized protein LOC127839535 [Dreissena polymorpha]
MVNKGTTRTINTRLQCITAMKEYENKSLEELRVEDYLAGRKGQELQTTGFRIAFPVTSTQQSAAFTLEASEHTGFGTTSTGTTGFGQPAASTGSGSFGMSTPATEGLFGNKRAFDTQTTASTSFGSGSMTGSNLFSEQISTRTALYCVFTTETTQPTDFGARCSGQAQQPGTLAKFIPITGTDTMVNKGTTRTINTRLQCITAMKEYENKSLEELRVEDYLAGRKGRALMTTGFGIAFPVMSIQQSGAFALEASKQTGFGTTIESQMERFVKGASVPLADGPQPECSYSKKISLPETKVSRVQPELQLQPASKMALPPPSALEPVNKRRQSSVVRFDHDGPKPLYRENVDSSSIKFGTEEMCAEFATKLFLSSPSVSETTGVITNLDVYTNIQQICQTEVQRSGPKGRFGLVTSITLIGGKSIVRKRIQRQEFSKNEVIILCNIKHSSIIKLYGVVATPEHVDLLMENGGMNLCDYMKLYPKLQHSTILTLFRQLMSGLQYLHEGGHRHLDIKPANICISQDLLKIIDFGSAKMSSEVNDFKGMTPQYRAPDIDRYPQQGCEDEEIAGKADMFSAGLVLMYMLTGNHFLKRDGDASKAGKSFLAWLHMNRPFIPKKFTELYRNVVVNLLKDNPSERWTSSQVLDVLKENVESQELQEKTPRGRGDNQPTSRDSTSISDAKDTAHINIKNETMGVSCPRENMPATLVDLHEGTVQNLPATNIEVVNTVSEGRKPVASFKEPRLDPQDGTERSICKAPNTEGWKPTGLVVTLSQSAKVIDDKTAVVDQAEDQHAGQEADESGMSTADTSGVTDEGEEHQPFTDDALADDAARDWSMRDPPDDQQNNQLPCFDELL